MFKFGLTTGLGNKDENKVKDLVLLWMKAGADVFDTSCAVLPYVQKCAVESGFDLNDYEFCVSIPLTGDIHGRKAKIDTKKCKKCGKCKKACYENAIQIPFVDEKKCVGCGFCKKACKNDAVEFYYDENDDFTSLLNSNAKIDFVEIHISVKDKEEIYNGFKKIIKKLEGRKTGIRVCFNRTYFSNQKTEKVLMKLKKLAGDRKFTVQTDGNSMNGGNNTLSGTIEGVAFGIFVQNLGYDVIIAGGANDYTAQLVKETGLNCPISYASFARRLTEGLLYDEALEKAKEFVKKTKETFNA